MSREDGFTLIELLSVIAIIAVLAAICIPVIHSAIGTATRTRISSNMRQIGHCVYIYVADNDDTLPGRLNEGQTGYYKNKENNNGDLSTFLAPYLQCPEYTGGPALPCAYFLDGIAEIPNVNNYRPYAVNMRVTLDNGESYIEPFGRLANTLKQPLRLNQLQNIELAKTPMIFSLDKYNASQTGQTNISWEPPFGDVRPVIYFDGHVEMEDIRPQS